MANKVDDLAASVAALTDEEVEKFERAVSGLRAERARAEEARIAGLRGMSDEDLVDHVLIVATERAERTDPEIALALLRDGGFVRGAKLEQAYRAGYERGFYQAAGSSRTPYKADHEDYVRWQTYDLGELAKDEEVPAYMRGGV